MKEKYYQDRSKTTKHIGNIDEILTIKYIGTDYSYKHQIVWRNVVGFILLHAFALWGLVLIFTGIALWKTSVWGLCILYIGSEGVTIGAHRCYAHRSFKATPLLRAVMVITQTLAGQVASRIKRTGDGTHHKMGTEEARTAVTAWGPLHPLNPTYTTTLKTPDAILKPEEPSLYQ